MERALKPPDYYFYFVEFCVYVSKDLLNICVPSIDILIQNYKHNNGRIQPQPRTLIIQTHIYPQLVCHFSHRGPGLLSLHLQPFVRRYYDTISKLMLIVLIAVCCTSSIHQRKFPSLLSLFILILILLLPLPFIAKKCKYVELCRADGGRTTLIGGPENQSISFVYGSRSKCLA